MGSQPAIDHTPVDDIILLVALGISPSLSLYGVVNVQLRDGHKMYVYK